MFEQRPMKIYHLLKMSLQETIVPGRLRSELCPSGVKTYSISKPTEANFFVNSIMVLANCVCYHQFLLFVSWLLTGIFKLNRHHVFENEATSFIKSDHLSAGWSLLG